MPEIAFGLSIEDGPGAGSMGNDDLAAELDRWKRLTPQQRLREAIARREADG